MASFAFVDPTEHALIQTTDPSLESDLTIRVCHLDDCFLAFVFCASQEADEIYCQIRVARYSRLAPMLTCD